MEARPISNINNEESNDYLIDDSESSQIMIAEENKENNQRKCNGCSSQCKNSYGIFILSIFDNLYFTFIIYILWKYLGIEWSKIYLYIVLLNSLFLIV
jgi:hypothetical protein